MNSGGRRQSTLGVMREPILPQRPKAAHAEVVSVEWLFEPSWPGDRLMVRVETGRIAITDDEGAPAEAAHPEAADVIQPAILADAAVVDGVWTAQPFIGVGSLARTWAETIEREGLADEVPDPIETERRRAFVAVDLVELDGQPLHDVPFQERRRLLESVIDEGVRVRLSPIVKQPIRGWLLGWRDNGFSRYVAKHQNARYRPGEESEEWLEIGITAGTTPRGMLGGLLGGRRPEDHPKRVTDKD
jgi:bifunctional non-homologous end joining protein LigD